jgi:transcriptional regulator of aromatic amino acid metabolism
VRVYIPGTVTMLRELNEAGEFKPLNGTAFALTPALREAYTSGSAEDLEYVAMADAARASLRLIGNDPDTMRRRVVIAADVDNTAPRPDLDNSVVRIPGSVVLKDIAAIHLDASEAEKAVAAAVLVIDAADMGDEDAEFALGDVEDHDLAWYATQELPFVLELM